jgi:hypothetical protein
MTKQILTFLALLLATDMAYASQGGSATGPNEGGSAGGKNAKGRTTVNIPLRTSPPKPAAAVPQPVVVDPAVVYGALHTAYDSYINRFRQSGSSADAAFFENFVKNKVRSSGNAALINRAESDLKTVQGLVAEKIIRSTTSYEQLKAVRDRIHSLIKKDASKQQMEPYFRYNRLSDSTDLGQLARFQTALLEAYITLVKSGALTDSLKD